MYEKLEECPICKFTQQENFLICNDHSVTKESFALVHCPKCTLVYTSPRPTIEHIERYYQSESYISHTNEGNNLVNILYKVARKYALAWKYRLVKKQLGSPTGSLLDYGCGTGEFLQSMANKTWEVKGIEPNEKARNQAINKGLEIQPSLNKENKEFFDIITAWHVIEHVHDLKETISKLRKRLTPDGKLIIAVPNYNSQDSKRYKEFWAAFDVPRHLYHFSQESIKEMAHATKLHISDTIGMPLDAYYVSMLSEKYSQSKSPMIRGLLQGYNSNKSAKLSGEYSSLIYVLSK